MKKSKKLTTLVGILSLLILASFCLNSCSFVSLDANARGSVDLMEKVTAYTDDITMPNDEESEKFRNSFFSFSTELFKSSLDNEKNSLISPLSVIMALGMTANGADGITLEEAEALLGELYVLNKGINGYRYLQNGQLKTANSIWIKDTPDFVVKDDFLKTNATYYGADAYLAPFDKQTLKDINNWVKENTDGEIDKILDELESDVMMCLINTVLFDAEWASPYTDFSKRDFRGTSGEKQVEMMTSTESVYLETENAKGFMKSYKNGDYSFAALLPDESVSLAEFISSLDGATLKNLFDGKQSARVKATIPKFSYDYDISMAEIISEMGWQSAFCETADFSKISDTPLYISDILHKTHIDFNSNGTKAAAATAVMMKSESASPAPDQMIRLVFDRPFMFVIYDNNSGVPVFIGTINEIN